MTLFKKHRKKAKKLQKNKAKLNDENLLSD